MLSSISFIALAIALSLIFENGVAASARRLSSWDSDIENSYIVKLKDGINTTTHINSLPFAFSIEDENSPITHRWPGDLFNGYSGIFIGAALDAIMASPDVEYVEKNRITTASGSQTSTVWNLQTISTRVPVGGKDFEAFKYTYSYTQPIGDGVDIYILDTGVFTRHNDFEGRVTFGWAAPGFEKKDGNGHGTHIAGIAAGKFSGVAKKANIIAVKVLSDSKDGNTAQSIAGLNWVSANVRSTGRPSIICMAYTSDYSKGLDEMITILVGEGVTVVASAGNNGEDASGRSPASSGMAIVVGASDITNAMWPDSNFGPVVDVFAPGVDILAPSISRPSGAARVSGTSLACAHVAGIAADILSKDTTMTPYPIFQKILSLATKNVISGVPPGTTTNLVYNGVVP